MTSTGIGARVARKEDQRFITGNGNYTDDINLPKQTYAYFVRSPHAHAKLGRINTKKAEAAEGVVAVLTGKDVDVGGLICGWMATSPRTVCLRRPQHPAMGSVDCVTGGSGWGSEGLDEGGG